MKNIQVWIRSAFCTLGLLTVVLPLSVRADDRIAALVIPPESDFLLNAQGNRLGEKFSLAAMRLDLEPRMRTKECRQHLSVVCEYDVPGWRWVQASLGSDSQTVREISLGNRFGQSQSLRSDVLSAMLGALVPQAEKYDVIQAANSAAGVMLRPSLVERNKKSTMEYRDLRIETSASEFDYSFTITRKPVNNVANDINAVNIKYIETRKVLLARGWQPVDGAHMGGSCTRYEKICHNYRELKNCFGEPQVCYLEWLDERKIYKTVTAIGTDTTNLTTKEIGLDPNIVGSWMKP